MTTPAPQCGCPVPLLQTTRSCLRCGHDLPTVEGALGPKGQAMALLVAEYVVEILQAKTSRQKPSKYATHEPIQLELGGEE